MACLRKKGNKYYIKDLIDGNEKWFRTKTSDKEEAEHLLGEYKKSKKTQAPSPFPSKTPLTEILSEYCLYLKNTLRHESFVKDRSLLRIIFGPVCDELKQSGKSTGSNINIVADKASKSTYIDAKELEKISTSDISIFLNRLMSNRKLSKKTINNYREMLHRFFNWAITQMGKRFPEGRNPAEKIKLHRLSDPEITYLSKQEIVWQLNALKDSPQIQAMVATLIFAGLRREELLWLRKSDIVTDEKGHTSIIIQTKTVDGEFWEPKNKKGRSVLIAEVLKPYLDPILDQKKGQQWLFTAPEGARWNPDNFSSELRDLNTEAAKTMKASGDGDLSVWSCNDYRHTFATLRASKGISLYVIASLMGNSVEICRKHYAKLFPSTLYGAINDVDDSFLADYGSQLSDVMGDFVPDASLQAEPVISVKSVVGKTANIKAVGGDSVVEEHIKADEMPEIHRKHLRLLRS